MIRWFRTQMTLLTACTTLLVFGYLVWLAVVRDPASVPLPPDLRVVRAARAWAEGKGLDLTDDRVIVYCDTAAEPGRAACRYCNADRARGRTSCTVLQLEAIDGWIPVAWTLDCPLLPNAGPCVAETYNQGQEIDP
jgi:hypothetical protein